MIDKRKERFSIVHTIVPAQKIVFGRKVAQVQGAEKFVTGATLWL
ncbi:hypothetical protein [Desulfobacter hydrogenophilus]|nr:hypothetical protein [Desulfobacter hydrogenophilus]